MKKISGKVIVLTGASSGIGRATALALASQGAILHLVARRADLLDRVCHDARKRGGAATPHVLDVRDADAVARMATRIHADHRQVDILINNAGVLAVKPFLETTDDDWKWTFDINLYGIVTGIRAFLPTMLEHGGGTIINISSLAGIVGNNCPAYCASKFAVVGLSESLAIEYANQGIQVTVVCPGVIATEIAAAANREGRVQPSSSNPEDLLAKYGVAPEVVARDIVRAIHRPRFLVLSPTHARILRALHSLFPGLTRTLLRRMTE